MVPYDHARLHARDFGGVPEDYLCVDEFLDSTKLHFADFRHRAILHTTFGMGVCEKMFGRVIKNRDGCEIPVREIARRHIMQDCGCVPTIESSIKAIATGSYSRFDKPQKHELQWLKENVYTPATA